MLCFQQLSSLEETFRKMMNETREQYNEVRAQVKETEQLRSQQSSSGVVFNLSNNQAPLISKLKSRRGARFHRGTTLPPAQGARVATRQETINAYQRYKNRAQAQGEGGKQLLAQPIKQMMDLLHLTLPILPKVAKRHHRPTILIIRVSSFRCSMLRYVPFTNSIIIHGFQEGTEQPAATSSERINNSSRNNG
jgi:hypothetical protein